MSLIVKPCIVVQNGETPYPGTVPSNLNNRHQHIPLTEDGKKVRVDASFSGDVDITSTPVPATSVTQATVAVAAAVSTLVFAANAARRYFLIQNVGSSVAYITLGATTGADGFALNAGGSFEWTDPDIRLVGAISAIGDGVTGTTLKTVSINNS